MNKRVSQALTLVALAEAEDKKPPAPPKVIIEGARVYSIKKSGEAKKLHGNVTLSQGSNVTLTQSGQNIQVAASGGVTDHGLLTGLGDDDHTQYVPVDGVARQLANAGYPNALLLSGLRAMTGDLDIATHNIFGAGDPSILGFKDATKRFLYGGFDLVNAYGAYMQMFGKDYPIAVLKGTAEFVINSEINADAYFSVYDYWTSQYLFRVFANKKVLFEGAVNNNFTDSWMPFTDGQFYLRGNIAEVYDINLNTDKMIKLSNETTGAAANAANRGKLRMVHGGAGVADLLYMCLKSAADTYSWVQVATG